MIKKDKKKNTRLKITTIATITVLSSSIIFAIHHNAQDDLEIMRLEQELLNEGYKNKVNTESIAELESALIKKSEVAINARKEKQQFESDYKILEDKYENNLKELNELQSKMKVGKTKRFKEFPKVSDKAEYVSWRRMTVESTAYTKYENGDKLGGRRWGNKTASGVPVQYGVISVDRNIIPLGTEVYIPSLDKVFVALDTGNEIIGNIIDIYFDDLEDCINWGRKKNLEVYVNM